MFEELPTAEELAEMADKGEDISPYISKPKKNYFKELTKKKAQFFRTNIDFNIEMLSDLDIVASKLSISRQAVIKMVLQDFLIRYRMSESSKESINPSSFMTANI